jgi:hypothetical protein
MSVLYHNWIYFILFYFILPTLSTEYLGMDILNFIL